MAVELPKRVEEGAQGCRRGAAGCRGDALLCAARPQRAALRRLSTAAAAAPTHGQLTFLSSCLPPAAAALFYRLKQKGFQECSAYSDAYAACCSGRVLSVAWACRQEMKALSNCMATQ